MMKAMAESGVQCVIMHSPDLANTNQPLSLREPDVKVSAEVIQKQDKTATPERVVMQGVRY
jgi:dihydropteroate synthase